MTLIVVTGPPAAGKTTYVAEHAKPGDVRIDLDHFANTLAGEDQGNHEHETHILTIAKAAIDAATKQDCTVWLIHTKPTPKQLDDYEAQGAVIHEIDPGKDVVMKCCKAERPKGSLFAAAKCLKQVGLVDGF
ncbi:AAA family ATPase [Corynebacterium aurimucosum]|uniref:AAA family ATPase n=1 Tax=Corynebacterium aurimucosum TaxID=169292 RepID=UPI0029D416E5|nr:AAA family ATPase [Corynebacterium aurimucosum]